MLWIIDQFFLIIGRFSSSQSISSACTRYDLLRKTRSFIFTDNLLRFDSWSNQCVSSWRQPKPMGTSWWTTVPSLEYQIFKFVSCTVVTLYNCDTYRRMMEVRSRQRGNTSTGIQTITWWIRYGDCQGVHERLRTYDEQQRCIIFRKQGCYTIGTKTATEYIYNWTWWRRVHRAQDDHDQLQ